MLQIYLHDYEIFMIGFWELVNTVNDNARINIVSEIGSAELSTSDREIPGCVDSLRFISFY